MKEAASGKTPGRTGRPRSRVATYPLNQCALFKLRSKGRLATLLGVELSRLKELVRDEHNYREFPLMREACPFTGKPAKRRWVQEPKRELKRIHERLRRLLAAVTPPPYAHGAVIGRSYRSNASAHVEGARAATFDLRDFYPRTKEVRVHSFFSNVMGCAPDISYLLTKLSCANGALPTGSPLSPILSLYSNQPMLDRLQALADAHRLSFTVYIDDLTFSGNSIPRCLKTMVKRTVESGGHDLAEHKTKVFGRRQVKHITGVAVHSGQLRVPHSRFLKARALQLAISAAAGAQKKQLQRKLAGLLGEAAFLDESYQAWSVREQRTLKAMLLMDEA